MNKFPLAIEQSLPAETQSLTELTHLAIKRPVKKTPRNSSVPSSTLSIRSTATTNPSIMFDTFSTHPTCSCETKQKGAGPERTRINRRVKSPRAAQTSPSSILIENFKQQHRLNRHGSVKSLQSSKSLASLCRLKNGSETPHETIRKSTWQCRCCCLSAPKNSSEPRNKATHYPTPNQSFTNDDDDDEKISSNDTSNRTPNLPSNPSSAVIRGQVHQSGTPGDVHRRERIRFMKEQKTAKILAVVVGGFILLWLPFFIMYVIPPTVHEFSGNTVALITWLGYFNSVINPFIYAYCSKQFRMAFWNITFGAFQKKSPGLLPISSKNKQLHQRRVNA